MKHEREVGADYTIRHTVNLVIPLVQSLSASALNSLPAAVQETRRLILCHASPDPGGGNILQAAFPRPSQAWHTPLRPRRTILDTCGVTAAQVTLEDLPVWPDLDSLKRTGINAGKTANAV